MKIYPLTNFYLSVINNIENRQIHSSNLSKTGMMTFNNFNVLKSYPVDRVSFSGKTDNNSIRKIFILIGAPNSGKGTISRALSEQLSMPYLSGGDILRDKLKRGRNFGKIAEQFTEQFGSAPKFTQLAKYYVCNAITRKLKLPEYKSSVVIEGFPRSIEEANTLKDILDKDTELKIIYLDVKPQILYKRSADRFICDECNKTYSFSNVEKLPKCTCGGNLIKRADDTPEILTRRLLKYEKDTLPLIDYYGDTVVRIPVENESTKSEEILEKIISAISGI